MPQGLIAVYFLETGEKVDMHPIDANEAMATGLYTLEAPAPKAEAVPSPPPARGTPAPKAEPTSTSSSTSSPSSPPRRAQP